MLSSYNSERAVSVSYHGKFPTIVLSRKILFMCECENYSRGYQEPGRKLSLSLDGLPCIQDRKGEVGCNDKWPIDTEWPIAFLFLLHSKKGDTARKRRRRDGCCCQVNRIGPQTQFVRNVRAGNVVWVAESVFNLLCYMPKREEEEGGFSRTGEFPYIWQIRNILYYK